MKRSATDTPSRIDGIENDFPTLPPGRQGDAYRAVQHFKTIAKHDWISTKARDGRKPLTEIKRWIKAVQPDQFYARWPTDVNDDSVQIWYTGGNMDTATEARKPSGTSLQLPPGPTRHRRRIGQKPLSARRRSR